VHQRQVPLLSYLICIKHVNFTHSFQDFIFTPVVLRLTSPIHHRKPLNIQIITFRKLDPHLLCRDVPLMALYLNFGGYDRFVVLSFNIRLTQNLTTGPVYQLITYSSVDVLHRWQIIPGDGFRKILELLQRLA
jgi:hypothetical protein